LARFLVACFSSHNWHTLGVDASPTVAEHRGPEALERLGPALDDLYRATGTPVTARRPWQDIWTATHPQWEPWLLTVGTPERLEAVAPLARSTRGPLTRVVGLGHGTADDARWPARTAAAADRLADGMASRLAGLGGWALLAEQLPAGDPVVLALTARLSCVRVRPGQGMPMVVVANRELNTYLSRNARQAEAKARNRLRRDGREVTERWVHDPVDVARAVPDMSAVHAARDAQLGRHTDHADARRAAFYRSVLIAHAERREVDLLLLEIDGRLAAYVAGFRDGRALRVWDNRVSPEWADYSAGRLANQAAIRHVVAGDTYDVLDWMRGEEAYKLSSATTVVPTCQLEAWSSRAARLPYATKAGVRALLDRAPRLERAARSLRHRGRSVD
jgi:CelD/BcsL family acetyltransferase involved in cellulose biosynthesis